MTVISNIPQITADCFIPLGIACRPAYWLRKHNLRYCSFPFDWMMDFSLQTVISTIKNGISSWFNQYIEDVTKKSTKSRYVTDIQNHIISMHGFPTERSICEYMPEFKEVFGRRYERMLNILSDSQSICFLSNRNDGISNFGIFIQEVKKLYPCLKVSLLNIQPSVERQKIIEYKIDDSMTVYNIEAYDFHKDGNDKSNPKFWIGNENLWDEICNHLSLSDKTKEEKQKDEQTKKLQQDELINDLIVKTDKKKKNKTLTNKEKVSVAEEIFNLKKIKILSQQETIENIKLQHISIARFGDGEILLMLNPKYQEGYQKPNPELSKRLREIFTSTNKNILICMDFHWDNNVNLSNYYKDVVCATKYEIAQLCNFNVVFGNTGITRDAKYVPQMKEIWRDKDIIVVEGALSRIGIGNDLFDNVKSIKRILCPAENAFDKYNEILTECKKQTRDKLFLIALGPTATILAYDLAKLGYWALDIGHIDIVYEWQLRKVTEKIAIPGKYTNEAKGGRENIEDCTDPEYLNSIITKVA